MPRQEKTSERGEHTHGQAAAEALRLARQFDRKVGKPGAMSRALAHDKRLHQGNRFAEIRRYAVRFNVRRVAIYHSLHNSVL